jgi:hypothetical protein
MPKETVPDTADTAVEVQVGWRRAPIGDVQVGVTNDTSPLTWPDTGAPFPGWFASLDRDGVNRLIRVLRRARDAAFGADA